MIATGDRCPQESLGYVRVALCTLSGGQSGQAASVWAWSSVGACLTDWRLTGCGPERAAGRPAAPRTRPRHAPRQCPHSCTHVNLGQGFTTQHPCLIAVHARLHSQAGAGRPGGRPCTTQRCKLTAARLQRADIIARPTGACWHWPSTPVVTTTLTPGQAANQCPACTKGGQSSAPVGGHGRALGQQPLLPPDVAHQVEGVHFQIRHRI